jgi:hypothetical protein
MVPVVAFRKTITPKEAVAMAVISPSNVGTLGSPEPRDNATGAIMSIITPAGFDPEWILPITPPYDLVIRPTIYLRSIMEKRIPLCFSQSFDG